ncbi:PepSY-associated TM helix domain-containing protein [Novosphingobium nitrogenifigens]
MSRGWWLKQIHTWHWISAAVALAGMLMFALTGLTLNHADLIPATPRVVDRGGKLQPSLLSLVQKSPSASDAPLPAVVARAVAGEVGLDPAGRAAEWNEGEVYVAMPRAGGDAWVSIDRMSGEIKSETTDQGLIASLNDLHKGRNTGLVWRLFIDAFAAAVLLFSGTGLLLLQFHANHRKKTWPLVGAGVAIPLLLLIFFVH